MSEAREAPGTAAPATSEERPDTLGSTLLRVAWLAILLGFVMEALLLLVAAGFGLLSGVGSAVAGTVKQVSWSVIVCGGLALGTAASKLRAPLMGLLGLVAGPAAFNVARSLHEGTAEALKVTPGASGSSSLLLIAVLKGVEYGCLGLAIGWIGRRPWGGLKAHVGIGLAVGIVFGGAIVAVTQAAAAQAAPAAGMVSTAVNEIIFPVGCALVLFSAAALGERAAR